MNELQQKVQSLLDEMVESGTERGVQAAAYYKGQLVVDAFAGFANPQTGQKVTGETLFPVFSTGKGIASTVIHRLVERGLFGYETPIANYWPEFAAHGKGDITVRHALNHTAGLPYMPTHISADELGDWNFMCAAIADMKPATPAGSHVEYHAITFGWILGEMAQRADGRGFAEITQQEICGPLGISTLFFGVPDELEPYVAVLEDEVPFVPSETPTEATPEQIPHWIWPLTRWMNRPEARRTCLPSSCGIMNAHAIARHYAALIPGGVDGVELLTPSRVQLARTPENLDLTEGVPKFGLGYGTSGIVFGHGGYGGSQGLVNPDAGWAFGFTRNRFSEQNSAEKVLEAIEQELKKLSIA